MSGPGTNTQQTHRVRLQRASVVAFWASCAVIAVSRWTAGSGLLWTVVEDCGVAVGILALLGLSYCYWRRKGEGRTLRRVLPNESQLSRFLASRRDRRSG